MPEMNCPKCAKLLRIPERFRGLTGQCSYCKAPVYVPCLHEEPALPVSAGEHKQFNISDLDPNVLKRWRKTRDFLLEEHFKLTEEIRERYKKRSDPTELTMVIMVCEKLVILAAQTRLALLTEDHPIVTDEHPLGCLPAHIGYEQLCIMRFKEGDTKEALRLALQAWEQGWWGHYEDPLRKRIIRYAKKLGLDGLDLMANTKRSIGLNLPDDINTITNAAQGEKRGI